MRDRVLAKVVKPASSLARKRGRWFVRDRFLKYTYRGPIPADVQKQTEEYNHPYFWIRPGLNGTAPTFLGRAPKQQW